MICRVCDSVQVEPVIHLGKQPWCNHFLKPSEVGKEPSYPLEVVYCLTCTTAQLNYTVPKEVMFGDHTYLSGITRSLSEHFKEVSREVDSKFFKNLKQKSVLDIGSNDGSQLKHFKSLGYSILGVESSVTTARIAVENDIPTLNTFFNLKTAQDISEKFHVINASGVFFHLEELHSVTEGVKLLLREDGVFVVQFLYMKNIVENGAFDQIYHEHLLYYNLRTIGALLKRHGLELFDAYLSPIHGGSIVGYVSHIGKNAPSARLQTFLSQEDNAQSNDIETYLNFQNRILEMKKINLAYLENARSLNKRVFGMGAPVKGNTLLNFFGVGPTLIEKLIEKNRLRDGLFAPGSHIPIEIEEDLPTFPDIYYVLAWNFKKEILKNNEALISAGVEFYFPVDPEKGRS